MAQVVNEKTCVLCALNARFEEHERSGCWKQMVARSFRERSHWIKFVYFCLKQFGCIVFFSRLKGFSQSVSQWICIQRVRESSNVNRFIPQSLMTKLVPWDSVAPNVSLYSDVIHEVMCAKIMPPRCKNIFPYSKLRLGICRSDILVTSLGW